MTSKDLSGKIISKARQGTAPVEKNQLHEVYVALGDLENGEDGGHFKTLENVGSWRDMISSFDFGIVILGVDGCG